MASRKHKETETERARRLADYYEDLYYRQAGPSWELREYDAAALAERPIKEIRAEYSRLRSIINKRIQRLEKSEFAETETVKDNKGKYVPLKDIKSDAELYRLVKAASRTVYAKSGSVTGQRAIKYRSIEALRSAGYRQVTASNFTAFGKFMEAYRQVATDKLYPSSEAVKTFRRISEVANVNAREVQDQFAVWLAQADKIEATVMQIKADDHDLGIKRTAAEIYKMLRGEV